MGLMMFDKNKVYAEGFYHLYSPEEKLPVLVHVYKCSDLKGQLVAGFNTHDGGSLLPLYDIKNTSTLVPVKIAEPNEEKKAYHIAWNFEKSEGVVFCDVKDAYHAATGEGGQLVSAIADMFFECYIDEGISVESVELEQLKVLN